MEMVRKMVYKVKTKIKNSKLDENILLKQVIDECVNDFKLLKISASNNKQTSNFKEKTKFDSAQINLKNTKSAIKVFKSLDKNDFLLKMFISILALKSVKKLAEKDKFVNLLKAVKYASLLMMYKINKKIDQTALEKSQEILTFLYNYNIEQYCSGEINQLSASTNLKFDNQAFYDQQINDQRLVVWQNGLNTFTTIFKLLASKHQQVLKIRFAQEQFISLMVEYSILKYETEAYLSKTAKSQNTIFVKVPYNDISQINVILIDKIKNILIQNVSEESAMLFIRNISETAGKVILSDDPPMNLGQMVVLGFRYLFLLMWSVIILYPVYIFIKQAFNGYHSTSADFTKYTFSFSGFKKLFTSTLYPTWLGNSLIIAVFTMLLTVFFVGLTAYGFSRFRYRGKKQYFITFLIVQLIPTFTGVIVYYVFVQILGNFGLPSYVALIIIYTGAAVVGNTLILKSYMDSISHEIDDAAIIDGFSYGGIFFRIIMPLSAPILILIAVWSFTGPFGDVILPSLILINPEEYTVALGLYYWVNGASFDANAANFQGYITGGLVISVPIALLFILLQRFVVEGMSLGGVKG